MHPHVCALRVVMSMLQSGLVEQHVRYSVGDYAAIPWIMPLFQLHEYLRLAICRETRTLASHEIPDLTPLLAVLPIALRQRVEWAMLEEEIGSAEHGAGGPVCLPPLLMPLPLEAPTSPTQPGRGPEPGSV